MVQRAVMFNEAGAVLPFKSMGKLYEITRNASHILKTTEQEGGHIGCLCIQ